MKTIELTGAALDWAVGQCRNRVLYRSKSGRWMTADYGQFNHRHGAPWWNPSTNWKQGGPIIEREGITISRGYGGKYWWAVHDANELEVLGPTPLVAAMRAYVTAKLGDEVDVPAELMEAA